MNLLELNHVEKSFGDLSVLKDISLSVSEGEIVSIIGPSGSGKSTLLRCATMLETMDHGEIVYLGKRAAWTGADGKVSYADKKDMKEIRSQYGLVFQNFNLFPHYSVLKNITDAPIHVQKRDKETVYKEARELLKKMGLEDKGITVGTPFFVRSVPACGDRPCIGTESEDFVFRRADLRTGSGADGRSIEGY